MSKTLAFLVAITIAIGTAQNSSAVDLVLTDDQIGSIRDNCSEVQINLKRLHDNDTVLRLNIAQRAENISNRLMAPLNSRIALNSLDGVELTKTTVNYNKELSNFKQNFKTYETLISDARDIDCNNNPVEFYTKIDQSKLRRKDLSTSVMKMQSLAKQYRTQVVDFKKQFKKSETSND